MFMFGLRLVQVQALQASDYRSRAVNEMEKVKTLQAPRGDITDINGVPLRAALPQQVSSLIKPRLQTLQRLQHL